MISIGERSQKIDEAVTFFIKSHQAKNNAQLVLNAASLDVFQLMDSIVEDYGVGKGDIVEWQEYGATHTGTISAIDRSEVQLGVLEFGAISNPRIIVLTDGVEVYVRLKQLSKLEVEYEYYIESGSFSGNLVRVDEITTGMLYVKIGKQTGYFRCVKGDPRSMEWFEVKGNI